MGLSATNALGCSNATLNGSYAMTFSGQILGTLSGTPPTLTPFPSPTLINGVQILTFDGEGNTAHLAIAVRNGVPSTAGLSGLVDEVFQPQSGTYLVNEDCTGTGTVTQPGQNFEYAFVIGNSGHTFSYVDTFGHSAMIPGNPNCVAPAGCDLAVQVTAIGEKVSR